MNTTRVLFLSHGGGPLPLLADERHEEMVGCLQGIAAALKKPRAIIVISAHWEEPIPTITAGATPSLIYDYSGFPEESYRLEYPCPGEPRLAEQVRRSLGNAGIEARLDERRGFDHGFFVPLKIMYPEADIPCIQLSLVQGLDPTAHLKVGRALEHLNHDGLLVIGSGSSFHNLPAFFMAETSESKSMNEAFEQWLIDTCSSPDLHDEERAARLVNWELAPFARYCHPREEHLLPLHVCCGIAQAACSQCFELRIMNKKSSLYLW